MLRNLGFCTDALSGNSVSGAGKDRIRKEQKINERSETPISRQSMNPTLNVALKAARDAAEAIAHASDRIDRIRILNADPNNFLTSLDLEAEKTLKFHILKSFPDHSFESRTSDSVEGKKESIIWLIDPLIGNRNFAAGYTQFGVSLACQIDGIIQHAVVIAPMTNEEFTASRGDGAQLNARRLRTGNITEIAAGSLVGLESPLQMNESYLQFQTRLLRLGAGLRISGCPALDIVNTAAGRLVGGWATQQPKASIAAASLILHEAGGLLGNENANPKWNSGDELIYGNLKTFKQLSKIRKNQP